MGILSWFSHKPPYYCDHGYDKSDSQYWECTYFTRVGKVYLHHPAGSRYITAKQARDIVERIRKEIAFMTVMTLLAILG